MGFNGIDTLNLTYNLEEHGIKKANVIDAMYTKEERYKYEPGGNDLVRHSAVGSLRCCLVRDELGVALPAARSGL